MRCIDLMCFDGEGQGGDGRGHGMHRDPGNPQGLQKMQDKPQIRLVWEYSHQGHRWNDSVAHRRQWKTILEQLLRYGTILGAYTAKAGLSGLAAFGGDEGQVDTIVSEQTVERCWCASLAAIAMDRQTHHSVAHRHADCLNLTGPHACTSPEIKGSKHFWVDDKVHTIL